MRSMAIGTGLILAAALTLSACLPDSINPLGDPQSAAPDPRLVGNWSGTMNDEPATLAVTAGEGAKLDFRVVTQGAEGKEDWVKLSGFPATLKNQTYINVKFIEETDKVYDPGEQNYYVCRYVLTDDGTLTVWTMAEQPVVDAIAAGRINGSVDGSKENRNIHITDSNVVLADFLGSANLDHLFSNKFAVFQRAAP